MSPITDAGDFPPERRVVRQQPRRDPAGTGREGIDDGIELRRELGTCAAWHFTDVERRQHRGVRLEASGELARRDFLGEGADPLEGLGKLRDQRDASAHLREPLQGLVRNDVQLGDDTVDDRREIEPRRTLRRRTPLQGLEKAASVAGA